MGILWIAVGVGLLYIISRVVYNLYFHPLAKFPGPKLWAAFRTPFIVVMMKGGLPTRIREFHEKYGDIVRIAPDEISFTDPSAWHDIYTARPGHPSLIRPDIWKRKLFEAHHLVTAPENIHTRLRKALQPAFGEKAIRRYEPLLQAHVATLINKIRARQFAKTETSEKGYGDVDFLLCISYLTFDIIGDLAFGETFNCLNEGKFHPSIMLVRQYRAALFQVAIGFYPTIEYILSFFIPKSARKGLDDLIAMSREKVNRRIKTLETDMARVDYFSHLARDKDGNFTGMSNIELETNCILLMIAGSESMTSALGAIINCLLFDRDVYKKIVEEVRTSFALEKDITLATTSSTKLPYLHAVIQESLRLCPGVPDGLRRRIPEGGEIICGNHIPAETVVEIAGLSIFTSSKNFSRPTDFLPERWLPISGSEFISDKRAAFQPFAVGSHNCVGQNLAWAQMRIFLCRLIWNFDFYPTPETRPWLDQKIFWTWEKDIMMVRFSEAQK